MKPAVFGLCHICARPRPLVIDHDHRSWFGCVRGLICLGCNSKLGRIEKGEAGQVDGSYLAYLADPPLARRRISYWYLKYTDVWLEKRDRLQGELLAWLSGHPVLF